MTVMSSYKEILIFGMAVNPATGDHTLADHLDVPVQFYNVELHEVFPVAGEIKVLAEKEELTYEQALLFEAQLLADNPGIDNTWI